ncbi:hypothetical protein NPIL_357781 [Nephila pilipes]|uniref:Uncharacterized protein n=1 Tax=Nephila pilipes TaxID=299642 RepID=A0A8X6NTV2_NEPPI|nr:hypothetical protein NPIL_357781 [Nephila pilipes]
MDQPNGEPIHGRRIGQSRGYHFEPSCRETIYRAPKQTLLTRRNNAYVISFRGCSSRLPTHVQQILAISNDQLEKLAEMADGIMAAVGHISSIDAENQDLKTMLMVFRSWPVSPEDP